jgi:hypothetical protein
MASHNADTRNGVGAKEFMDVIRGHG